MTDCSRCPVLDLGKPYPPGSPRSPWRRMPVTFATLRAIFGPAFYNPKAQSRRRVEKELTGYCARTRDRYGEPCPDERIQLCARLTLTAVRHAGNEANPYAAVQWSIRHMADDWQVADALAATRLKPNPTIPLGDLDEPDHTR